MTYHQSIHISHIYVSGEDYDPRQEEKNIRPFASRKILLSVHSLQFFFYARLVFFHFSLIFRGLQSLSAAGGDASQKPLSRRRANHIDS